MSILLIQKYLVIIRDEYIDALLEKCD